MSMTTKLVTSAVERAPFTRRRNPVP
jgi:hypothetical protein